MENVKIVNVEKSARYGCGLFRTYRMSNDVLVTIQLYNFGDGEKKAVVCADITYNRDKSYKSVWEACHAVRAIAKKYLPWNYFCEIEMQA